MLPNFSYIQPETVEDAVDALTDDAVVCAGGSDLLGCMREGIITPGRVVSLEALDPLKGITKTPEGGLAIGAMTTIADIAKNPLVNSMYPGLAQGARQVASPQLRNQGTIGGNLCQKPRCWYYRGEFDCLRKGGKLCYARGGQHQFHAIFGHDNLCFITHPSDTAPPLVSLNARVLVKGPVKNRTIPVAQLHVAPSFNPRAETVLEPREIITQVVLPPVSENLKSSYRKVRARRVWDFALAGVALALEMDGDTVLDARVVLSGAAPIPWRSIAVEKTIIGRQLNTQTIAAAAAAVTDNAEPLENNAYKTYLFQGIIEEELTRLTPWDPE
ncbi:MAG: xanthine dehydrogenase family protein subunit M [Desulfobacteraceae bacterium]|nr:xanthine dehydrogenase family protein subunit M [Desulfobacteraceae bacterium]